jgi:thiol-disulfide isomerase/thioredoxin
MRQIAIVLVSVIIGFLLSVPVVQAQFSEAGVEKFRVPVEAPDFTLQEIGGGKVSLKELRGKIILLNFFASW